jgi:uncharacterized protein
MPGSLHAWYSSSDLEALGSRGTELKGELKLDRMSRLGELLHDGGGSVKATLRFRHRDGGGLMLDLDFEKTLALTCQRCLERLEHPLAEHVELAVLESEAHERQLPPDCDSLLLGDDRLNRAQLLVDELNVGVPLVPKHEHRSECGSLARVLAGPEQ